MYTIKKMSLVFFVLIAHVFVSASETLVVKKTDTQESNFAPLHETPKLLNLITEYIPPVISLKTFLTAEGMERGIIHCSCQYLSDVQEEIQAKTKIPIKDQMIFMCTLSNDFYYEIEPARSIVSLKFAPEYCLWVTRVTRSH